MHNNSILITGAAGNIGSYLVDKFVEENWKVTGIDNLLTGNLKNVNSNIYKIIIDNFDSKNILERIRKKEFDVILHNAAIPRVLYSVEHPSETNDINVGKTVRLLEACVNNIKRFVFASSSSVYGNVLRNDLPVIPEHLKNPISPYALQKSIIEDYCRIFSNLYNIDTICLRYFNVISSRAKGDSPYSTVVSAWLDAIKNNRPLRFDGDGNQTRDLCYIDNIVQANFLAVNSNLSFKGDCFNVACGDEISNNEIFNFLKKRFPNITVINANTRPGDVKYMCANIEKTKNILGYKNVISFWKGLERIIFQLFNS